MVLGDCVEVSSMYLKQITLQNFRCFGEKQVIEFNKGLNVLVGENDSGKTAIIDAIRIVLGTTDQNWYHIESTDFYQEKYQEKKDTEINISLRFSDLSRSEQASFLEYLSFEETEPCLYVHWKCKYLFRFNPPRTSVSVKTGKNGDGPSLSTSTEAKELLRVTYLRPLRDSYLNMQAGRNSRLSQIVQGIPSIGEGQQFDPNNVKLEELSISGIASFSNYLLANHHKLKKVNDDIGDILNSKMLLKGDEVKTTFEVAGMDSSENKRLISLLEKLDLTVCRGQTSGKMGLGTSNILSMACELLLNRNSGSGSSFLLIEEPEAHIHAQRQLRLIQSLQADAASGNTQIIVTTHSQLMASVVNLENILIVKNAKVYPLRKGKTKLEEGDYRFLERYLDVTKANLFFAKSVMMVEGPSEELLIPTVAKLLGKDFTEYGVSVVNVRGVGFSRFARIFQRADDSEIIDVKVACVTDRDIMPDCAVEICKNLTKLPNSSKRNWKAEADFPNGDQEYLKKKRERNDGQQVRTFVSDHWTFEYDLAYAGLADELIKAISATYVEQNRNKQEEEITKKYTEYKFLEDKSAYLYSFFSSNRVSKAEVAQHLSFILEDKYLQDPSTLRKKLPRYIIDAIEYVTQ